MIARLRAAGCVYAEDEASVLLESGGDIETLLARREAGEPLEYVIGWAQFDGLRIPVAPGVFIPRRRTQALLARALTISGERAAVLELCCGAAPVAVALKARLPDLHVCATDVDEVAVACARQTLPDVYCGDLFAPVPRQRFDLIVANAPYVPTDALATLPRETRSEHVVGLDGGADGLDVHRRIAGEAAEWLNPGGAVLCEVAPEQAESLMRVYAGYDVRVSLDEDYDVAVAACVPRVGK